ncbi:MAG TPA: ATP-binding protein [Ramlibacter sp.]|nr:ATP-binding protein [Ramlibacter sp.]
MTDLSTLPPGAAEAERRRLDRLRLLAALDTEPEPVFDSLVAAAAAVCGTPIALVSLIDERRQWFKANHGLDGLAQTPRDGAFCAHAIEGEGVMQVPDAMLDPRFAANPLVTGAHAVRFYAGAPIVMPGGERIGTLCVIDRCARAALRADQVRALEHLAKAAGAALLEQERHRAGLRSRSGPAVAEAASQAKDDFLATVSHEILTPLNGVLGMTRLLRAEPLDERPRQYAGLIENSAQLLLGLVNDLLDLGKIEAGQLELEHIDFGLGVLLADLAALYAARARERQLAFALELAPDVPAWVKGDPGRLRQVLDSLLDNALKFTSQGGVRLEVDLERERPGQLLLCFTVRDTGIGIAPEIQDKLFARFVQADASATRRYGGAGLGLAIVRQLCERMGGAVSMESSPGHGSAFRCALPFGPADPPVDAGAPSGPALQAVARPERLLVAEDNATNQIVIQGLLEQLGFEQLTLVANGQEVVDAVLAGRFDAVLMDCQMPELDGYAATRQLRALGCELPVLAMTANATAADRDRCLQAGMNDHLPKPLDPARLARMLDRWLPPTHATAAPAMAPGSGVRGLRVFEREAALERLGGDEVLLRMVIASFMKESPRMASELEAALAAADAVTAHRLLHTLAGSAGACGANALQQLARALEVLAGQGALDAIGSRGAELRQALDEFRAAARASLQ